GRAPAAARAAHVDGVAHPPLQDRHRGLPGTRGRGVRGDRVAPRRARLLRVLRRRAEAVAREVPRALVRGAGGDGDVHERRADRGHDRDRRLARHGDGGGRPVVPTLYDAIQVERAKYPEGSRSAVLPALRLAQGEHGWLSPDVIREVADALEVTPAFVASVATFYEPINTEPLAGHMVEVCPNVSCALYGAPQVRASV